MKLINFLTILFVPISILAKEINYFDSRIDFWGEKLEKPEVPKSDKESESNDGKFPWKAYLDPKNKEFFKEGDYTPPEPFMEVARNPTDENIKQWFELMKKKNELQTKLQIRMQEYIAKNNTPNNILDNNPPSRGSVVSKATSTENVVLDPNRFKFRMYFESTCPHCRKMFSVLKKLKDEGFSVEALQIDRGPVSDNEKVVPIVKADDSEVKRHKINGVPFLLIADSKRKGLLPPIQGFHGYEEIKSLLKQASK